LARTDDAEFIEGDCGFWRFRHVKNTALEIVEYRRRYLHLNYDKKMHIKYYNNITCKKDVANVLDHIFATSKSAYKIHIAVGIVLVHVSGQKWEHYTVLPPMQKFFLEKPAVITSASDNARLKSLINESNIRERFLDIYPDTKTEIAGIFALGVTVYPMTYVVGAPINLPEYITTTNIPEVSLNDVKNNMCFFAACAISLGARRDRYMAKAKELFISFYGAGKSKAEVEAFIKNYKGFDYVSEHDSLKGRFRHAIEIVDHKADKLIELIKRSKFTDRNSMHLNLHENHFSGIANIKKLSGNFMCKNCGSKFEDSAHLKKHSCINRATNLFVKEGKSIWNKPRNILIEACDYYEVSEIDFKCDYIVVYDLESIQVELPLEEGKGLKFIKEHVAVSVSIASNIRGN
jgi:hypothetical protein